MPELQDVRIIGEGLEFPEGPIVESADSVLVCEIRAGSLSRVWLDGRVERVAELGGGPNGAAYGPDGAVYVTNNGRGGPAGYIQRVDVDSGRSEVVYADCDGVPFGHLNDLVFDSTGGFWFTDYSLEGAIFYGLADGSRVQCVVTGTSFPNGVGLSPDEQTLYWATTTTRQVHRRRIEAPGRVRPSNGYSTAALFADGGADRWALLAGMLGHHELDSLAIDSAGHVCVGTLLAGGITDVSPDGEVTFYALPERFGEVVVTNLCFGGADLRTAYITLSQTGRLARCTWHRPGLATAFGPTGAA